METINITKENLRTFRPIKKDTVWTDGKRIYKKDYTFDSKKDYYEIFRYFEESENCILPDKQLLLNGNPFGYTTSFDKDRTILKKSILKKNLLFKEKLLIIKDLIKTVKNIHSIGLTHCDIHPNNILISKEDIRLIDFDCSKIKGHSQPRYYSQSIGIDIAALNTLILNLLSDEIITSESTLVPLIEMTSFSEEFKQYLEDAILEKEDAKGVYPDSFINEINGNTEYELKRILRRI